MRIINKNDLIFLMDNEISLIIIRAMAMGANHAQISYDEEGMINYKESKIHVDALIDALTDEGYIARKSTIEHNSSIAGRAVIVSWYL